MKTELADGRALFTKPCIMKKLINTYLPEGPMMTIPSTPINSTYLESLKNQTKNKLGLDDIKKFQSFIGLLIQLLEVRPDIAFALSKL